MNHKQSVLFGILGLALCAATLAAPLGALARPGAPTTVTANTIAYIQGNDAAGDSIHLIEANGTNDRTIWSMGQPGVPGVPDVSTLSWRPDGTELAFASRHEEACSFYAADIYAVRADGSGYRRVTAPPACGATAGMPTGTVEVDVLNWTWDSGPFIIYIEGAPGPQSITLAPGDSATLTFTNVADYGDALQWVSGAFGQERYNSISANANVVPGQTVATAGPLTLVTAYTNWAWRSPTWRFDGSKIGYVFAPGILYAIDSTSTVPGDTGLELLNVPSSAMPGSPDGLAWSPVAARANQLLYAGYVFGSGSTIFLVEEGSTNPGTPLVDVGQSQGNYTVGLAWLPDGSGFLYTQTEGYGDWSNLYRYDFASGNSTAITNFSSGYILNISPSPDGQRIVYEFQATGSWTDPDPAISLYVMNMNGTGSTLLVPAGRAPVWNPQVPFTPQFWQFLPAITRLP